MRRPHQRPIFTTLLYRIGDAGNAMINLAVWLFLIRCDSNSTHLLTRPGGSSLTRSLGNSLISYCLILPSGFVARSLHFVLV